MDFAKIIDSFSVKPQPRSEVELSGDIPAEAVARYRDAAIKHIVEHMELPGFRKGKVPASMAVRRVGEMAVLEEAVELLMRDLYPELVTAKNIDAIGRPDIRITKLAPGNPASVIIRTAVYPAVEIPSNWKRLAAQTPTAEAAEATDEEVNQTLHSLRESRNNAERTQNDAESGTVPRESASVPHRSAGLDDEFARSIGAFKDVEDLKTQIRKGIAEEKLRAAKDVRRGKIIDALLEKTQVDMPRIFVESELDKILAQMKEDIKRMAHSAAPSARPGTAGLRGMSFNEYLKRTDKTEESIRNEFRLQAEKRATLQLLLNKIAEEEKIEADEKDAEAEMKHALEHFPDAEPERVSIHIRTVLRNEKVLKLLEEQK